MRLVWCGVLPGEEPTAGRGRTKYWPRRRQIVLRGHAVITHMPHHWQCANRARGMAHGQANKMASAKTYTDQ
jgi:hypothetical protein